MTDLKTKELSEAIVGALELAIILTTHLKDGFQFDDLSKLFAQLFNDQEVKSKLDAAFSGYAKISEETKLMEVQDYVAIASIFLNYLPKFIDALKPVAKNA
jgi:hypothetical protein